MKIPKTINILGVTFKVKFVDDISKEKIVAKEDKKLSMVGYCSCNNATILLCKVTNKQNYLSVFIHEILEAIDGQLALHLKHDNIDRLEVGLYQVLTTNKLLK